MNILDELFQIIMSIVSSFTRDRQVTNKMKEIYHYRFRKWVIKITRDLKPTLVPWQKKLNELRNSQPVSTRESTRRSTVSNPNSCRECRFGMTERTEKTAASHLRFPVKCCHPEGVHKPYRGMTKPTSCPIK